jgi:hypothetical protein
VSEASLEDAPLTEQRKGVVIGRTRIIIVKNCVETETAIADTVAADKELSCLHFSLRVYGVCICSCYIITQQERLTSSSEKASILGRSVLYLQQFLFVSAQNETTNEDVIAMANYCKPLIARLAIPDNRRVSTSAPCHHRHMHQSSLDRHCNGYQINQVVRNTNTE